MAYETVAGDARLCRTLGDALSCVDEAPRLREIVLDSLDQEQDGNASLATLNEAGRSFMVWFGQ